MPSRIATALLAALLGSALAVGCGGNSRPFVFGGNPNQSPGTNPSIAPADSRTVVASRP